MDATVVGILISGVIIAVAIVLVLTLGAPPKQQHK
jgi:hypothetical protein